MACEIEPFFSSSFFFSVSFPSLYFLEASVPKVCRSVVCLFQAHGQNGLALTSEAVGLLSNLLASVAVGFGLLTDADTECLNVLITR